MLKCKFATREVEYQGHIVLGEGINVDPTKIKSMIKWRKPQNIKALKGWV